MAAINKGFLTDSVRGKNWSIVLPKNFSKKL